MRMFIGLFLTFCCSISISYADTNHTTTRQENIVGKTIFKGRAYYDKIVQKKFAERQKDKNNTEEKKPLPRRRDGSIDTYKFLNENKH